MIQHPSHYIHRWSADGEHKHIANVDLTQHVAIGKWVFLQLNVTIRQVGPGYVLLDIRSSFGDSIILQTVTPLEPLVQKMAHYIYGPWYSGWFCKLILIGETINVARDIMIWNHKKFVSNPLLPKEDKQIKLFRNWFAQFYSNNSKSYADTTSDLSW